MTTATEPATAPTAAPHDEVREIIETAGLLGVLATYDEMAAQIAEHGSCGTAIPATQALSKLHAYASLLRQEAVSARQAAERLSSTAHSLENLAGRIEAGLS